MPPEKFALTLIETAITRVKALNREQPSIEVEATVGLLHVVAAAVAAGNALNLLGTLTSMPNSAIIGHKPKETPPDAETN